MHEDGFVWVSIYQNIRAYCIIAFLGISPDSERSCGDEDRQTKDNDGRMVGIYDKERKAEWWQKKRVGCLWTKGRRGINKSRKKYVKRKSVHIKGVWVFFFPALSVLIKSNAANNEDNKQRWTQKDEKLGACKMCVRREAEINKSSVCTRNANQC